ncbi:paralemmin-2-like isoform X2 [Parambassis ranga]|nr:paralemmin-2-like isoform X2 [Parambassis ranga]XP_028268328.1 paralemmin-2-like isoform X2 [Parambassis ranga]XP_028268329.1 paralemmin-2-like isoform X2 [Parambassis ranga]
MAQRTFDESELDGRSVLGMVAVQVERDPKTGETVVRSVAPVSTPAGGPKATTIFDDGRKSIHAVGGSGVQPSTEELGQILSVIDGVGMTVLLDEVTVTPKKADAKAEILEPSEVQEEKVMVFTTTSKEDDRHLESSRSDHRGDEVRREKCAASVENKHDKTMTPVMDIAEQVDHIEDQKLQDGPVTLLFLGYTDSSESQEDPEGMITVERVIISEDGEEEVIGPETSASLQPPSDQTAEKEGVKQESKAEAFLDVPLDENGVVQGQEGDKQLHNSSPPSTAEGKATSKRKTCQCCSVM